MQISTSNKDINQTLENILAVLDSLNKLQESNQKTSKLADFVVGLQENTGMLQKHLLSHPTSDVSHSFYENTHQIFRNIIKLHSNSQIRQLLRQTQLPAHLNRLVALLRETLVHVPALASLINVLPIEDLKLQLLLEVIISWDIRLLPRDMSTLNAVRHYHDVLQQKADEVRILADEAVSTCERLVITIQQEQQKHGIVSTEAQEEFMQASLLMYATHAAATLAELDVTEVRVVLDEIANEILLSSGKNLP
jgi:hypothetical protein